MDERPVVAWGRWWMEGHAGAWKRTKDRAPLVWLWRDEPTNRVIFDPPTRGPLLVGQASLRRHLDWWEAGGRFYDWDEPHG